MRFVHTAALILFLCSMSIHAHQVNNGTIVDHNGQAIQLRGVNWFGFETQDHVVHGLWARNWRDMVAQIKAQGFNAVRIPVCPGTLQGQGNLNINYGLNPDLQNMDSRQVLDTVLNHLDAEGLYILLDHHRPDCNAISELWYTSSYSEQAWINDLVWMAERYKTLPYFIGIDLKNEPHGSATWGTGNSATDWNSASERAAAAILAEAPDILIFVEGIETNPDCTGMVNHWWGGNLEPLNCYPLNIPEDKLVLSPHVYGPDVFNQPYFNAAEFPDNMPAIWDQHFGQFIDQGYAVIIGEFGGQYGHGGDTRDPDWQNTLVDYLLAKDVNSGFYWSWNPNSGDTGGILQDDWNTVWQDKVDLLNRLWGGKAISPVCSDGEDNDGDGLVDFPEDPGCSSSTDSTETDPASAACADSIDNDGDGLVDYPDDSGCSSVIDDDEADMPNSGDDLIVSLVPVSEWETGYCSDVHISNPGNSAVNWRIVLEVEGSIYNLWNAVYSQTGQTLIAEGLDWNNLVQPGQKVTFGFCAEFSQTPPPQPSICNDGLDNDGDGLVDFPHDPGCLSADDSSELDENAQLTTEVIITSEWASGYCADVIVSNSSSADIDWDISFSIEGVINNLWNANYSQNGATVSAEGLSWNNFLLANSNISFGFCANK
ncbi:glycoside hydrolase family 5 protein [Methyloprofundus sedimenti]|uniref:glycoside hydrolase family 5 protein n=1 Tax=Methyloprofundus sedimenti TaxID=1420851 RepID=UPI0009B69DCA|nr:glycoside hydrolase family 5 protein [Methyloprofundus sedimenti]